MQRESFTKALMATAKIACCAGLLNVSCRTKTPVETAEPSQNTDSSIEESHDTGIQDTDTTPSDSEFEACQPIIQDVFGDGAFPDMNSISDEVKDCCALTAAYYDNLAYASGVFDYGVIDSWAERDQCCAANEWSDGSMACTPWGPPTPPSAQKMKRRVIVPATRILA